MQYLLHLSSPGVLTIAPGAEQLLAANLAGDRGLGLVQPGEKVIVTGHSLGGHLAQVFALEFPEAVQALYTFNGAGLGGLLAQWTEALLPDLGRPIPMAVPGLNIVADHGFDFTAGFGRMFGDVVRVFNEKSAFALNNHSISWLVDSLALYDLANVIDPGLSRQDIGRLLDAASALPSHSLETALKDLRVLFGGGAEPAASLPVNDREAYYAALLELRGRLSAMPERDTPLTVLAGMSPGQIIDLAMDPQRVDVRYALDRLQPFAVSGIDYAALSSPGRLELEDVGGRMGEAWIGDRADLLGWVMARNIQDISGALRRLDPGVTLDYTWFDTTGVRHDLRVEGASVLPVGQNRRIYFGSDGADVFSGGSANDRLYGMEGDDRLSGGAGDDYIEGGPGDDVLIGGAGSDALFGGEGDDRLETDAGADHLNGGPGFDTYVLSSAVRGAWIEDADRAGRILIDGREIAAAAFDPDTRTYLAGAGDVLWFEPDGSGAGLLVIGGIASVPGFRSGDLGIVLTGGPSQEERPEFEAGGDRLYAGGPFDELETAEYLDTAYITGNGGSQIPNPERHVPRFAFGSPLDDTYQAAAGERPVFHGRDGNDVLDATGAYGGAALYGGRGDDIIVADGMEPPDPDEPVAQPMRLLVGGAGADLLLGGDADEVIFGDVHSILWSPEPGGRLRIHIDGLGVLFGPDIARPEYHLLDVSPSPYSFMNLDTDARREAALNFGQGPVPLDTPEMFAEFALGGADDWDDWIDAGDGDNFVAGGPGDDWISTGGGNDIIFGDNPTFAPDGLRRLFDIRHADGEWLRERLTRPGSDTIHAGAGDDYIYDEGGLTSVIDAGPGDDIVFAMAWGPPPGGDPDAPNAPGFLHITLGEGNDTFDGGAFHYFIDAGPGDDFIAVGGNHGLVLGGAGDDTIVTYALGGTLRPGDGSDLIRAPIVDGIVVIELGEHRPQDHDWLELDQGAQDYAISREGRHLVLRLEVLPEGVLPEDLSIGAARIELRDWFVEGAQRLAGARFGSYDEAADEWVIDAWDTGRITQAALAGEGSRSALIVEAVEPQVPEPESPPETASSGGGNPGGNAGGDTDAGPPAGGGNGAGEGVVTPPGRDATAPVATDTLAGMSSLTETVIAQIESAGLIFSAAETARRAAASRESRELRDGPAAASVPSSLERAIAAFFDRTAPAALSAQQWIDDWMPAGSRGPAGGAASAGAADPGGEIRDASPGDPPAEPLPRDDDVADDIAARYQAIDAWLSAHLDEEAVGGAVPAVAAGGPDGAPFWSVRTGQPSIGVEGASAGLRDLSGQAFRPLTGLNEGLRAIV